MQKGGITFGFDAAVEDAIISKETDSTINGFVGEVVDIVWGQEQYLGAHQRGQDGRRIATLRNNSLRSSLQKIVDPGMCGSSDAVPVEFIL